MSLGEYIHMRRKYLKLTQEELSKKVFVSKSAIAKWETNRGVPDRDNMLRLAEVLGTSISELYSFIEQMDNCEIGRGEINITTEVIALLESHGYKVIKEK